MPAQASETGAPSRTKPQTARTQTAAVQLPARSSAEPVALWNGYGQGGSQRVRQVQRALRELHYRPGPADGLFGPLTERAVVRFQRAEALQPDGIVGPRTLGRMRARIGQPRTTATPPRAAARAPQHQPVPPMPHWGHAPAPRDLPAGHAGPGAIPYLPLVLMLAALVGLLVGMDVLTSRRHGPRAGRRTGAERGGRPVDRTGGAPGSGPEQPLGRCRRRRRSAPRRGASRRRRAQRAGPCRGAARAGSQRRAARGDPGCVRDRPGGGADARHWRVSSAWTRCAARTSRSHS